MVEYGVRRTGDGVFYLVTLDEHGDAHEFYSNGALVMFDSSHEAKDYIKGGHFREPTEEKESLMAAVWKKLAYEDDVMLKTVADANSILYAVSDNTPAALAMAASTIPARLAAGNVVAATTAEILTLLGLTTTHNMFSAVHADSTGAANPVDGDIIIGNATPKWSKLAISIPGTAGFLNVLGLVNGELRPSWKAIWDATVPTTIGVSDAAAAGTATVAARRDHQHASPATFPPGSHALSAHSDAAAAVPFAGYQATNFVTHQVANAAARAALTGVVGKVAFQVDTLSLYICTALA